ncbi:ABC transporter substrate-binding protein [Streptomyces sp. NPDC003300]|uniref:ABC transporter substrate-binding protein n=1 Tax=unclassified Streptomyces TaxID=2593676 RepID=UPI0033B7E700
MVDGLFAGRYELAELLGSGGMARVHRARDTRMGRAVAVKTLLPELASDPDARRRFAREAQAAGALNHPGIVTVHDQDEVRTDDDTVVPYLVMEYVRGSTLAQLVREQVWFAPERAARIAADVLDALAHAHSHGTVHRDVKPANVMITTEGAVKVADFGIAHVLHSDARLTATGSAIGTPSYMSPEQINGVDVDARSDVYAVGCVLTELLTGRPPFTDGNPINLMYWHVHTPPPAPSARNPRVPEELDALVLAALAKDPAERPEGAAAFRDQLRGWLAATGSSALTGPAAEPADGGSGKRSSAADPRATFGVPGAGLPALPPKADPAGAGTPPRAPRTPAGSPGTPSPSGGTPSPSSGTPSPSSGTPAPSSGTPSPSSGTPSPSAGRGSSIPPAAASDATPPPRAAGYHQPEHPAYRAPQRPVPPQYLPSTPPPLNVGRPAEPPRGGAGRRRWMAGAAGLAVTAVAVTVTLTFAPFGGKKHGDDKPTDKPTVQNAALQLHGGKEGSGYSGGLNGVVRPSTATGGTLKLISSYASENLLDPAATYDQPSWNLQRLYLRKLVDYAPAPGGAGRKVVPDLATDTGQVSSDGRTWTFRLKDGVTFDNGAPITSKDVKYGIERTFARDEFPGGPTHLVDLLDQGQNYQGPYTDSDPGKLGLRSVATPDDRTIVFRLAKPYADFRYVLALSIGAPVPQSADTGGGKDFGKHPVGSGPYRVASYTSGASLHLVRNTHWDPRTDTVHSALPDAIDLKIVSSQDEVETDLLDGSADLDLAGQTVSDQTETKILNDPALKANTDLVFNGTTRFLSLQTTVAPFDRYECRWAVQYAIDKAQVRAVLGGQYAGGEVATTMLPPTTDGYSTSATPFGTNAGVSFPDEARKYLGKCGKPNGFTVTMAGVKAPGRVEDAMQSIRGSLAEVGITVKIVTQDASTFYDTLLSPSKLKSAKWGIVMTGWAADWPTGGGFLRSLIQPGSINNYAQLDDSEINGLVTQADGVTDPAKAASLWQAIDAKVMGEGTMVPLIYTQHLVYRAPRLTNVYEQPVLGGVDLTALGVKQ